MASMITADEAYEDDGSSQNEPQETSTSSVIASSTMSETKPTDGAHDMMYCDEMYHQYLEEKKKTESSVMPTATTSSSTAKSTAEATKLPTDYNLSAGSSLIVSSSASAIALLVALGLLI